MYLFESLTNSLPSEKGHGKDSIRNFLEHEDKPRTLQGHHDNIVRTTKRQKGQMRTNVGQPEDKKGLAKGRTDRKYNFTGKLTLYASLPIITSLDMLLYLDFSDYLTFLATSMGQVCIP